jgi:hypothetical protein
MIHPLGVDKPPLFFLVVAAMAEIIYKPINLLHQDQCGVLQT